MPFKKTHLQGSLLSVPVRSLFIGRANELLFFVQHILKPEEPIYNILSIWGQGGVGKTTLLEQFKNQAMMAGCLIALVDERQTTPASIMEKFAHQLHLGSPFEKALHHYKEALQFLPPSRSPSSLRQTVVTKAPDLAGSLLEGIPIAGPPLREVAKAATEHLLDHAQTRQEHSVVPLNSSLEALTQVFVIELNHRAEVKDAQLPGRPKRKRKILLFFDTFEQVADEVVPWLLHSVLELEIHPNIVLVIAGRDPLERSTAAGPKQWLPYYETQTMYALPLHPFTHEETCAYLAERGITTKERIDTIWHLSHGLPLYLGLLASDMQGTLDPTKDVVDNFLHRIPDFEPTKRRFALDGALFSKPFNLDDLEAFPYLSEQDRPALYEWLLRQPFVRASSLTGRYIYHELAQELFQRYLLHYSPKTYYASRRALAEYYQGMLEYLQTIQEKHIYGPTDERLEVMLALVSQCFFLPDEESHLQALSPCLDILEYADREQEQALMKTLHDLVQRSSSTRMSTHAYQVIQELLRFIETTPTEHGTDQKQRQEWFQATDNLLKLSSKGSSPSSEVLSGIYDECGWGYLWLREYQQAIVCFERALELHPSSGTPYNGLGQTHYYLKEYQQAIDDFKYALQLVPHHPHVYSGRGRTYLGLKAYQQALSDLNHALQLDRRYVRGYYTRSHIYMALKEHQKALSDLDHVLKVAPGYLSTGRISLQRGCIYLWLKDPRQALDCFTHGYEIASAGDLFFQERDWSAITRDLFLWVREWSAMCQRYPDSQTFQRLEAIAGGESYTACVCRGALFWLHNEFEQALAAFQHAATLHYDPDWQVFGEAFWQEWDALFWAGMTYAMLDREEEARNAIEEALAREMPPILLKPLCWFERERPKLYEQFVKPLLGIYDM